MLAASPLLNHGMHGILGKADSIKPSELGVMLFVSANDSCSHFIIFHIQKAYLPLHNMC